MTRPLPALILALSVFASGCVPPPPPPIDEAAYPWELRPASTWPREVLLRQRVEARASGGTNAFDAILQHRQGVLTLIGLTPFGARAFVLEQRDLEVSFRPSMDRPAPFPPKFMLIDIQRVFFPIRPEATLPDGEHELELGGERVTERWRSGRLERRTFERLDSAKKGAIVIEYDDWRGDLPFSVQLKNPWFGYEMSVTTLEATAL
jgi:hypothetical protein